MCNTCKKKLDVCRKSDQCTSMSLATFEPHSENCAICFNTARSSKMKGSFWKDIESAILRAGFLKCVNLCIEDKVFYKTTFNQGIVESNITLIIKKNLSWIIKVFGKPLPPTCEAFRNFPKILAIDLLEEFSNLLSSIHICSGNCDFSDVVLRRIEMKEPFPGIELERVAIVESKLTHAQLLKSDFDTVRHVACDYLITKIKDRCNSCSSFRNQLFSMRVAQNKERENVVEDTSTANLKHLTNSELILRLENVQNAKRQALKKVVQLSSTVSLLQKEENVEVTLDQSEILKEVLIKENPKLEEGTPMWLLWQQQVKQLGANPKSMRWHPLIIRWCLSIYHISPAAYKQISSKRNKFITLPHVNTLKKYINYTTPTSGFNPDVIKKLVVDSKLSQLEDIKKNVSLSFDEMKFQQGLVYQKSSGKLIGFCEFGDINEEIETFQ